jgi:phosphohistidine phosphatase
MANLLLWRHAEAEMQSASGLDADRRLTRKGEQDASKMARWLNQVLPDDCHIFTSPATRCLQTVHALSVVQQASALNIQVVDVLKVDASLQVMIDLLLNQESHHYTLIVGHQPNLGEVICHLIGIDAGHCAVKKGAVWWIKTRRQHAYMQRYLYALQQPALLNM